MKLSNKLHTLMHMDWQWAWRYYRKNTNIHLHYRLSQILGRRYFIATVGGTSVKLTWTRPYEHHYAYQESHGRHEGDLLIHWQKEALQARVTVDAGAYNGMYGLLAAAANPSSKVYIIEANPTLSANIKKSVAMNNLTNVTFLPKALTGTSGVMHLSTDEGGSAAHLNESGGIEVETTTLTSLGSLPDLIKLDIVGAEYDALFAAKEYLKTHNVKIFLELYPENKARLLPFLQELGYTTQFVRPRMDGGVEYYFVYK